MTFMEDRRVEVIMNIEKKPGYIRKNAKASSKALWE